MLHRLSLLHFKVLPQQSRKQLEMLWIKQLQESWSLKSLDCKEKKLTELLKQQSEEQQ